MIVATALRASHPSALGLRHSEQKGTVMIPERDRILSRARHLLERYLEPARFGPALPLALDVHHVHAEPVSYDEAVGGPWEPFEVGGLWGGTWDTSWFRLRAHLAQDWARSEVELLVDLGFHGTPGFGAEGLLWHEGTALAGVSPRHCELALPASARASGDVELYLEAAANPRGGGERLLAPEYGGPPRFTLGRAELAVRRQEIDQLCLDLRVLAELAAELPVDERRSGVLLGAIRKACALIDPRALEDSAKSARAVLAEPLADRAADGVHRVSAIGHAHIDTAWLWPLRETVRKCARTFSTALGLMERYPEYYFACSQAQQHAWMRERYPELFARIQEQVARGRFEPVGSMWVEPDCNLPSGESLVRQFLYGKRFFLEAYGVETTECWLPDAFGYPASLPQIMEQAGVDAFVSQKMSWNEANRFPHHSFLWEGIDGTRVLAHFPPADTYNGDFSVRQLLHGARNFADHQASGISLYPFGYGDGGGGPTREMLERSVRTRDLEGLPRVTLEPAHTFLDRLRTERASLPHWVGELYLELHRGTYTSQAEVKLGNRRGETALRDAELWSAALEELRAAYPAEELESAWKLLLVHQFHDILPGSSINWVYKDTARDHAEVLRAARAISARAEAALAASVDSSWASAPVVLLNACSHDRDEVVALPGSLGPEAVTARTALVGPDGSSAMLQRAHDGAWLARVRVPSCGWAVYDLADATDGERAPQAASAGTVEAASMEPARAAAGRIENGLLGIELDEDGLVCSIYDKVAGREVVRSGARANLLQLHDDEPARWDAWDVDEFARDRTLDLVAVEDVEVLESGPLRAGIRMQRRFGSSVLTQTLWLRAGSARIDFETRVDWHERHRLLKVAFPVAVRAMEAAYEIQFGHVRRPTHTNTSWDAARFEVCGHRFADLSEAGYGVALLNDARYGYDVRGDTLRLSLLRSPTAPDPEADQGVHSFTYSLLPHQGDLGTGGVIEEGLSLNTPLRAIGTEAGPGGRATQGSLVSFDRPGVVLEALKRSEDGAALVLRCYEARGGRGPVAVRLGFGVASAWRADLLERPGEQIAVAESGSGSVLRLDLRPFEIVTCMLEASS